MATLVLSDNEHYILKCILGYVMPSNRDAASLIDKVFGEGDFELVEYDKVVFTKNAFGEDQIKFNEGENA